MTLVRSAMQDTITVLYREQITRNVSIGVERRDEMSPASITRSMASSAAASYASLGLDLAISSLRSWKTAFSGKSRSMSWSAVRSLNELGILFLPCGERSMRWRDILGRGSFRSGAF